MIQGDYHAYGDTAKTKAQSEQAQIRLDWNSAQFSAWNPSEVHGYGACCGIDLFNKMDVSINNCYVELVGLYERVEGGYKYKELSPCTLPWVIDNNMIYEKIEIEPTKHR